VVLAIFDYSILSGLSERKTIS